MIAPVECVTQHRYYVLSLSLPPLRVSGIKSAFTATLPSHLSLSSGSDFSCLVVGYVRRRRILSCIHHPDAITSSVVLATIEASAGCEMLRASRRWRAMQLELEPWSVEWLVACSLCPRPASERLISVGLPADGRPI